MDFGFFFRRHSLGVFLYDEEIFRADLPFVHAAGSHKETQRIGAEDDAEVAPGGEGPSSGVNAANDFAKAKSQFRFGVHPFILTER